MTARATFSQAAIARAIRAAEACGKVAVMTPQGILFADPGAVALPSQEEAAPAPFDSWKAKREARREGRS